MIKIVAISMIALLLVILLKRTKAEFAFIITIAASILLFRLIVGDFFTIIEKIYSVSSSVDGLNAYVSLMAKILGITLITQFVIDLCRDCGENALASQTEITSKIIIMIMVMPLFESVMKIVAGLLK